MRLFGKRDRGPVVPSHVRDRLADYGAAAFRAIVTATPVQDPSFGYDGFQEPVFTAMQRDPDTVVSEIHAAAIAASDRDYAVFGAYRLLAEYDPKSEDARFLELQDASVEFMRRRGLSSGHLTGYESDRWVRLHGDLRTSFDNIVDVPVPLGDRAEVQTLDAGEVRLIASTGPLPEGNTFHVEKRPDGQLVVFSERLRSADDPVRERYDESQLGTFENLPDALRAVGAMFRSRPYWAHEDLDPYFTEHRG